MKKLFLSLTILLTSLTISAQGMRQFNPEDMAKRQVERIKEACATTDDQYKAIYDLFLAQTQVQKAEMDSLMASGQPPRFDREAMQKRREATNAEIKKILTPEQYAKYEEMQKARRNRGPRRSN